MSEKKGTFDAAAKVMKEKLEAIFSKDDPDEASPEDGTARPQIIGDIAYELAFGGEEAMRESKGPFDDAIYILRLEEQEDAIRLLEAAGKVDKVKCLKFINENKDRDEKNYGEGLIGSAEYPERKQIRALLASLPERDKEEK